MSGGELEFYGAIHNLEVVKRFLLDAKQGWSDGHSNSEDSDTEVDWNESNWGQWTNSNPYKGSLSTKETSSKNEAEVETSSDNELSTSDDWLYESFVASSPVGDIIAIARGSKAVFFCRENSLSMNYVKSYQGTLAEEEGEIITCLTCIPLMSKKRTSTGSPDWTCIVIGFNSGWVRVYTDNGNLLVSQQFHDERIQSFKVRSYVPSTVPLQHDQLEELVIIYRTLVVTIDGFGFFQTLRACRNNLARVKANVTEGTIEPPSLVFKKWGFESHQTILDCDLVGIQTPSTFDHFFTASLLGGVHARPRQNPPTANVFVATGLKPYVTFYHAQENQATPVLTEMAYAVASKVKSTILNAATGWLGIGGKSSAPKNSPKELKTFESPIPMLVRFGIPDMHRHGKSILTSPSRNLSVVTDNLGRVTLIDNKLGIVVRVWKGYRDVQCSWLQVDEKLSSKSRSGSRVALFLVIYAPRRQKLEVFAMQQGPKVASFDVGRHGRLLSATFGMMGLNNMPIRGGNRLPLECVFLECDGKLFTLNIPFHLGLCDRTSTKVKDIHLLKALHKLLRDPQCSASKVTEILGEIKTQSMQNQGFRYLTLRCNQINLLSDVCQSYSEKFCEAESRDLSLVFRVNAMVELYESLTSSQASPPPYFPGEDQSSIMDKSLLYCLHASDNEISFLSRIAESDLESILLKPKVVTFESDKGKLNLTCFFASFLLEFDPNKTKTATNTSVTHAISSSLLSQLNRLEVDFKSDHIKMLGELMFSGCLNRTINVDDWKQNLRNSDMDPKSLLTLCFLNWCQNALLSSSYIGLMEMLYYVIKALCDLEGMESVISDFNQVSKWWEEIRKEIITHQDIFPIYSFAIVCRAVAIDLQNWRETDILSTTTKALVEKPGEPDASSTTERDTVDDTDLEKSPSTSDFENISLDLLKWNILLKQIEDLYLLSTVLRQKPILECLYLPLLQTEAEPLTVIKLLDKGKGCVAELVGRWLTTIGIDPVLIINSFEETSTENKQGGSPKLGSPAEPSDEVETGLDAIEIDKNCSHVIDLLKSLKDNFPVSLSPSIILSNYCWEFALEWKNETNNVEYLDGAIKCAAAIPSPHIRQGMMSMMWNIFINKKLASIAAISKTTGERLVDKPSGFTSNDRKLEFIQHCVHFLDLFMDTNMMCETKAPTPSSVHRNHWTTDAASSNASLTDLALIQPQANFEMILLHYQLALCTHFFYTYRLRGVMKPTNLFDTKSRALLFQNLHTPGYFSSSEVDLSLKTLREEFLCVVISGAVRNVSEELPTKSEPLQSRIIPTESGVKECEEWVHKVFELGRLWGVELDGLRISYVCELYSRGLDSLGHESIGMVHGRDILGTRLLLIAGMRLSYLINQKRENIIQAISSISTNLSKWLDSLDYSRLLSLRFSKDSIPEMTQEIMQLIPETSYDFKLAEELLTSTDFL